MATGIGSVAKEAIQWATLGLIVLVAFIGPLIHGGTHYVIFSLLQVIVAIIGIMGVLTCGSRGSLFWFPLLIVALGVLQVVPWPSQVLQAIAPASAHAWELASSVVGRPLPKRISVAPGDTIIALRQLFLASVLVPVTAELARDRRKATILAWAVALVGFVAFVWGMAEWIAQRDLFVTAEWMRWPFGYKNPVVTPLQTAAFGRVQTTTVGKIHYSATYWVLGDRFGPYLVSNHFAGCLELTFPLFLALSVASPLLGHVGKLGRFAIGLSSLVLVVLTLALGASARAGVAGILIGGVWVTWGFSGGRWRMVAGAALTALVIIYLGLFIVSLFAKELAPENIGLSQLTSFVGGAEWRTSQWLLCLWMFWSSPCFGLGLGSFAAASPYYQASEVHTAFAHSDYFQLLAEMGVIGLFVFLGAAACVIATVWRYRKSSFTRPTALEIGASGCLAAFLPHGWVDWNLHIPANAFLFAIVLGLFLGIISHRSSSFSGHGDPGKMCKSRGLFLSGLTVLVCLSCLIGSLQYMHSEKMVAPLRRALLENMRSKSELPPDERADLLIKALPPAVNTAVSDPWNAEYAKLVGLAYLHLSQGKDMVFLEEADRWLTAAICRSPFPISMYSTVAEIRLARALDRGAGESGGQSHERIE